MQIVIHGKVLLPNRKAALNILLITAIPKKPNPSKNDLSNNTVKIIETTKHIEVTNDASLIDLDNVAFIIENARYSPSKHLTTTNHNKES